MTFHYKQYSAETIRPIIPITILFKGKSLKYEVLVDSGADGCVFHSELAELLGIVLLSGKPISFGGITGIKAKAYLHKVQLSIDEHVFTTEVAFAKIPSRGYGVVGQKGFFEFFKIGFDYSSKEIEIKEIFTPQR